MAKIIKQSRRKYYIEISLCFYRKDGNELSYGFLLINGKILPNKRGKEPNTYELCSEEECSWWKNYLYVKDNPDYYSMVTKDTMSWMEPAIAICECGKEIGIDFDASPCPYCGRLHNLFGQELLPKEMW